jgi:hypothetical protein
VRLEAVRVVHRTVSFSQDDGCPGAQGRLALAGVLCYVFEVDDSEEDSRPPGELRWHQPLTKDNAENPFLAVSTMCGLLCCAVKGGEVSEG